MRCSPRSPTGPRISCARLSTNWSPPSWFSAAASRPMPLYTFKHALVQDVAYQSLLKIQT